MKDFDYLTLEKADHSFKRKSQYFLKESNESYQFKAVLTSEKFNTFPVYKNYNINNVVYFYNSETIGELPYPLIYLINSFKNSESILLLKDDWDENGSKKYELYTWKSAIKFIIDYATTLYRDFNILIDIPKVYNGPNSSIDILWENETYTMLINISKNGKDASFYADNTVNTQRVRGEFKLNDYLKTLLPFAIKL